MKLFTRYHNINLLATILVFLLSGIAYYFVLRVVLIGQVDEDLRIEQHEIETYVSKYARLPEIIPVRDQVTTYSVFTGILQEKRFTTLKMTDPTEHDVDVFRRISFTSRLAGQTYLVTVSKSLEGTDAMITSIVTITLVTILVILILSLVINRILLRTLWKPFYGTLHTMENFALGSATLPAFPATKIDEFKLMNETLLQATRRASTEYRHLKDFTENAAHELQTPLAIIRSKMDLLIQDEHLSEPQSKAVQGAYEAIGKLSRLNQGLLLLTKIENGQYARTELVHLRAALSGKLEQFEEMIQARELAICIDIDPLLTFTINPDLLDLILNNLLSNAIRYTITGGQLIIDARDGRMAVSNSAANGKLDQNLLFRRFSKTASGGEGVGLGLALVAEAAAVSGFQTQYLYQDAMHQFVLSTKHP